MSALAIERRKIVVRFAALILMMLLGSVLIACGTIIRKPPAPTAIPTPRDTGEITALIVNNPAPVNIMASVLDVNRDIVFADIWADDQTLLLPSCGAGQFIAVWSPGFYIQTALCDGAAKEYSFTLEPYDARDNAAYAWIGARNIGQLRNCEPCHAGANGMTEYLEWSMDGHATTLADQYFWTVYQGADISRRPNSDTRWTVNESGKHVRMMPDPSKPYYGPGFKTDRPAENGNCAYCHAPASLTGAQIQTDLAPVIAASINGQISAATEGVTCDVCHKVLSVQLDQNNRPFLDKPGILSFDFMRDASSGKALFTGPLAGVRSDDTSLGFTCSPVFSRSEFCAPCHYGKFWDTQIYNSYGEWMESPYANVENTSDYKTCQACHMAVNAIAAEDNQGIKTFEREACSQSNVAYEDFSHNMMRRDDGKTSALIKDAASLKVEANKNEGVIQVKVRVINERAGHKFPTDSPMRHLILLVEAKDEHGTILPQLSGPTIPAWGGTGSNPLYDFAGRPGEIYANILMDVDTNVSPSIAYWNPTRPAWENSDTRLSPRRAVDSEYSFTIPSTGASLITVRLIYRYAFIEIARQKGWFPSDIPVVDDVVVTLP